MIQMEQKKEKKNDKKKERKEIKKTGRWEKRAEDGKKEQDKKEILYKNKEQIRIMKTKN